MLDLLLLRHAKSSWDHNNISDHDRPLSERGLAAAPRMADHIATNGLTPDLILCSTSARTRATLSVVLERLSSAPPVVFEQALYLAEDGELLARINRVDDAVKRLMIIGHNPGFEDLARSLSGRGERAALAALHRKFPTCGLAVITFDVAHWSNIGERSGTLTAFITPRSLEPAF